MHFDPRRKHMRFNTPVEFRHGPPIGVSRNQLYPVFPELAAEMYQGAGPKPWMNRSIQHGRTPNTAQMSREAINAARAQFLAARKMPVPLTEARALLRYSMPQAPSSPTPGAHIRQVPFQPRAYIPPEAVRLRAAMLDPASKTGVQVLVPAVEAKARFAELAILRRIK